MQLAFQQRPSSGGSTGSDGRQAPLRSVMHAFVRPSWAMSRQVTVTRRRDPETLAEASGLLGVSIPTAARLIGISTAAAYEAFKRGELPGKRIAGRCIVSAPQLLAMFGVDSDVGNAVAEATSSLVSKPAHECKSCRKDPK
jgi:hypothetical protein